MNLFQKKKNKGQSMVEYIALTALIAIVCIGGVKVLGGKVRNRLGQISKTFDRNISQGLKPSRVLLDDDEESPRNEQKGSKAQSVAKSILDQIIR